MVFYSTSCSYLLRTLEVVHTDMTFQTCLKLVGVIPQISQLSHIEDHMDGIVLLVGSLLNLVWVFSQQ